MNPLSLREKVRQISLRKINDIYYVPPGVDGSIGLSDKQIDEIITTILGAVELPEKFTENSRIPSNGTISDQQYYYNLAIEKVQEILDKLKGKK